MGGPLDDPTWLNGEYTLRWCHFDVETQRERRVVLTLNQDIDNDIQIIPC